MESDKEDKEKSDFEDVSDFEDELNKTNKKFYLEEQDGLKQRRGIYPSKRFKHCYFCEKKFDRAQTNFEQKFPKYKCQECYDANIQRKPKLKEVVCNFCGNKYIHTYNTKRGLTETKTKTKKCDDCKNRRIPRGPLPRPQPEFYECDICGKRCKHKIRLYIHMDSHRSDVACKVCGSKYTARSALRAHLRTHFENFICDICGFNTNVLAAFRVHKKIHLSAPQAEDQTVEKKKKKRAPRGVFPCSVCGLVFDNKGAEFSHYRRQHGEEGVHGFKCKVCGEVYYRQKEFRIHVMTHSEKPLIFCHFPGCNMYYNKQKRLNIHIKHVHNQIGASTCEICQKTFKYKASLYKHLKNNRCVPLKLRNQEKKRDCWSKKLQEFQKTKTDEELERFARIAKEQYLEVRGLATILKEDDKADEQHDDMSYDEGTRIEETIVNENVQLDDTDDVINNESNIFSEDVLDVSPKLKFKEDDEDENIKEHVAEIKAEFPESIEEPLVKIEIKTEPEDIDTINNTFLDDDWNFLRDDNLNVKIDPETCGLNCNMEPYVRLERLDYETIMTWTRVKHEPDDFVLPKRQYIKKKKRKMSEFHKEKLDEVRRLTLSFRVKGQPYECDICGAVFKHKKNILNHLVLFHKRMHVKKEKYGCDFCQETFLRKHEMEIHRRRLHSALLYKDAMPRTKDYICDLCGKGFYSYQLIKMHLKITHLADWDYECNLCGRKFKSLVNMKRHQRDVHFKLMKFPCQYCGKFLKRNEQLKHHELAHITPKSECKICGKMVINMKQHILTVHGTKKPQQLFPCSTCGKSFNKHALEAHIKRMHLKVMGEGMKMRHCQHCSATFCRVDELRRHNILNHFQGVIKKCPYENCDSIFKKTAMLNLHIKNCHKTKYRNCIECGKTFASRSALYKHCKIKGHEYDPAGIPLADDQIGDN